MASDGAGERAGTLPEDTADGERIIAKLREIVAHCEEQQALVGNAAVVVYVLPGRSFTEGKKRRLWKGNGPLGRPVGVVPNGVATMFDAREVIAAAETQIARWLLLQRVVEGGDAND
jgi:hypothetical protein